MTKSHTDARENDDVDAHLEHMVFAPSLGTETITRTREPTDTDISGAPERVFAPEHSLKSRERTPTAAFGTDTITKTREPTDTDISCVNECVFAPNLHRS